MHGRIKTMARAIAMIWLGLGISRGLAATLVVRVEAVSPRGGNLRVALYDRTLYEGHDADPVADRVVNAVAPETIVEFDDVAPGTYAIKMFQDINRNGQFDMNFLGLPGEPFGFSNDARPLFDQPSFDAAKFTIGNGQRTITVHLRHWFSDNRKVAPGASPTQITATDRPPYATQLIGVAGGKSANAS